MSSMNLSKDNISRVLIIGGGCAGEMVIHELERNPQLNKKAIAIIDDDLSKIGKKLII